MIPRLTLFVLLAMILMLAGCTSDMTLLEQVIDKGKLKVVTKNSATTYYQGPFGDTGLEYDLMKRFADHLGVKLEIIIEENYGNMFKLLESGKADIVAANLSVTQSRKKFLQFGPGYLDVVPQVVYRLRNNNKRPRKVSDLINSDIEVAANSAHAELLTRLKKDFPELSWQENAEVDTEELLELVWSQFIDYTVADSTEIKLKQRFFPELAVAFDIGKPKPVAWALVKGIDDTLYNKVVEFFSEIKKNGVLKQLINKYYGHVRSFNYVGTQAFMRDVANKLPKYINLFKLSAHANNLDWRLLAAVGYQESHWNPDAVSPTGVKGIMMLTQNTAEYVGILDRKDTIESIEGGAKYLRYMIDKMPSQIREPDRTWLALAAYNVGYGHLEDARKITQRRGGNPDKWVDVKENLPLLSKKKWYSKTKHGYARGNEPVKYVSNIRNYYDLLVWNTEETTQKKKSPRPIIINSPTL